MSTENQREQAELDQTRTNWQPTNRFIYCAVLHYLGEPPSIKIHYTRNLQEAEKWVRGEIHLSDQVQSGDICVIMKTVVGNLG